MEILKDPLYLSSASALVGGLLVKLLDFILRARSQDFREAQAQRVELWGEIKSLKKEVAECRDKHDACQKNYYALLAELRMLKEAFARHAPEEAKRIFPERSP